MEFIDIHSHYAWDIDDGISSLEDAKTALAKAQAQGIKQIVAILFLKQLLIFV